MKVREKRNQEFDKDSLKIYMDLPAKKKLEYLENINLLLGKLMPHQSKRIWQELKSRGW